MSGDLRWMATSAVAVAKRPDLWRTTAGVLARHAPNRWWARRPFLPVPDREWMGFRFETAFADVDGRPDGEELIDYLEWARSLRYL